MKSTKPGHKSWSPLTNPTQIFSQRAIIIFSILMLLSVAIIVQFTYRPLKAALEECLIVNFRQISDTRYEAFEHSIHQGLEGARSLSSRSFLREVLLNYADGDLSLAELTDLTQRRFEEGAEVLERLVKAERCVGTHSIAHYAADGCEDLTCSEWNLFQPAGDPYYEVQVLDGCEYLVVVSPIYASGKLVGHDKLLFSLQCQLHDLCTETIQSSIVTGNQIQDLMSGIAPITQNEYSTTFYKEETLHKAFPVGGGYYFLVQQEEQDLLSPVHRLQKEILLPGIGILLLYTATIYIFIVRYARKELESSMADLNIAVGKANRDPLTHTYSRAYGEQSLSLLFEHFKKSGDSPAIFVIDVDGLKAVNDDYGHLVGDAVIQAIAQAITSSIRENDIVFRWGGDEFIGLFRGLEERDALARADSLLEAVSALKVETSDAVISVTISIGISYFAEGDYAFSDAVQRADRAMYESKLSGKNTMCLL